MPVAALVPSTDEIFGWIETIFAQGVRRPGYPADRWSERWIRDRFDAFGLDDVRFEPLRLPRWEDAHTASGLRDGMRSGSGVDLFGRPRAVSDPHRSSGGLRVGDLPGTRS